jgi:hypothetical protein
LQLHIMPRAGYERGGWFSRRARPRARSAGRQWQTPAHCRSLHPVFGGREFGPGVRRLEFCERPNGDAVRGGSRSAPGGLGGGIPPHMMRRGVSGVCTKWTWKSNLNFQSELILQLTSFGMFSRAPRGVGRPRVSEFTSLLQAQTAQATCEYKVLRNLILILSLTWATESE